MEIGKNLNADYVIAGSVRWSETETEIPEARTTLRVVRLSDDIQVWSESFDRSVENELAIQSEIAQHLTRGVGKTVLDLKDYQLPEEPPSVIDPAIEDSQTKSVDQKKTPQSQPSPAPAIPAKSPPQAVSTPQVVAPDETTSSDTSQNQAQLEIEFVSFVPHGNVTIYADDTEILNEDFQFPKRGILGGKRPTGKLLLERHLPLSTDSLRIHLTVGNETQLLTLQPEFTDSPRRKLFITVTKRGPAETRLE